MFFATYLKTESSLCLEEALNVELVKQNFLYVYAQEEENIFILLIFWLNKIKISTASVQDFPVE